MPEPAVREEIAIVGMAGHFPGARDVETFWKNLRDGVESISFFTAEDLASCGVDPAVLKNPGYVPAAAVLEEADSFDAAFFGYTPREAELMDPQHRRFLECAWEAIESAGYDPANFTGSIGVFSGVARNTYLLHNLAPRRDLVESVGIYPLLIGNDKDFPATRVSFKLNLRGPSLNVQTACSTSGVAVHLACQSLLSGECDMALAGGARIQVPLRAGYFHQEGGILSPDGHCRAFDARARGTVIGSGAAVIVLRRLSDALRAGDHIHAVLKATAINNDGSAKVGFTAPSVEGQAAVIAEAHAMAEVTADTIGYIEAHGTGTAIGDPIEIAALTKAFRRTTAAKGFCAIGSVKTNIGHLDAGAGVTGIIKTALSLTNRQIPPSLHFETPNPEIDFANSPFFVNASLREWPAGPGPRRAGVSSFGLGGTNFHAVLEEAPLRGSSPSARPWRLLTLSARTESALETMTANLAAHLGGHPELDLGDAAYTLQTGRRRFAHRRTLVCRDGEEAVRLLEERDPKAVSTAAADERDRPVAFLFPGGGAQYPNMGLEVYRTEPVFAREVDAGLELLRDSHDIDLLKTLFPPADRLEEAARALTSPLWGLPALFVIEHALARLLISWGIRPAAVIGHSLGEYVAAAVSGVISLEDAVSLVVLRARLFERLPEGGMLSVPLPEAQVRPLLPADLSVAAVNGPSLCVVSGPAGPIAELKEKLLAQGIESVNLRISVAAHSAMVEPILEEFGALARRIPSRPPQAPCISNVTGTWMTRAEAGDPEYWVRHLRQTVRFAEGLETLSSQPDLLLLEVGPGRTLTTLAQQQPGGGRRDRAFPSLRHPRDDQPDAAFLLASLGKLWASGAVVDWEAYYAHEPRRRVPLPAYPFERKRFWIEAPAGEIPAGSVRPRPAAEASFLPSHSEDRQPLEERVAKVASDQGASSSGGPGRRGRIVGALVSILHELSGVDPSRLDPEASFLALGFESLFLTQASAAFQSRLGVRVSLRQLLETTPNLSSLAAFIDGELPPDALTEPAPERVATPSGAPRERSLGEASTPAELSSSSVERIVAEQLRIMAEQLEVLRGFSAGEDTSRLAEPAPASSPAAVRREVQGAPAKPAAEPARSRAEKSAGMGPWKPIEKGTGGGLTARQREHLDRLIESFTARTAGSKRLTQEHRAGLADPRTVAGFRRAWKELVYPIVVTRAAGSKLWDVDGNEWLDVTSGYGITLFGHSAPFVVEAVARQLEESFAIGPQTPLAGEVAEAIREFTGMDRVAFCNTGSEAVLAALRMARTVTGRERIALFSGDYHGIFDEVLVKGITVDGSRRAVPVAPGIPRRMVENVLVLDYGEETALAALEERADELAAVLVEPVQSRRPELQPREFLHRLRELTARRGIPLVFDEIVTGFRVHPGGAQAYFGVKADIAAYGKVLGGGLPIGVVAGSADYLDALDGGGWSFGDDSVPEKGVTWFAGTFVRHPLALAAARAVLRHLKEEGPALQRELNEKTGRFVAEANTLFEEGGFPIRLSHFASLFSIEFQGEQEFAGLFWHHLRAKGVHAHEGRPNFLTTAHSEEDMAFLLRAFRESAEEMRAGGFLPEAAERRSGREEVQATDSQRELWRECEAGSEASCALNLSYSVELRGELDAGALSAAFAALVQRHDSLRIRFSPDGTSLLFSAPVPPELAVEDLSGLEEERRRERVAEALEGEARTPFDLVAGPLWRVRLMRLEQTRHLLLFTIHHAVSDAFSSGTLLRDLGRLYSRARRGEPPPEKPMQFSEFALQQRQRRDSPEALEAERYWLERCAGPVPALELPADRPRPAQKTFSSGTIHLRVDRELLGALKRATAAQGCTLFSSLLGGFALLLHSLSGSNDLIVAVPSSGHSIAGDEGLVGECANIHPFRSGLERERTAADYLKTAQRQMLEAHEHREVTYGRLLETLRLPADPSRHPLFSVQFNMDPRPLRAEFDGLESEVRFNSRRFYLLDLGMHAAEIDGELALRCEFNSDLFDERTVRGWLARLLRLLRALAEEPHRSVGDLFASLETGLPPLLRGDTAFESAPVRVPVTDPQREVWAACQMGEDASSAFNETYRITLRGDLDAEAMRRAIHGLVARHDALRASFEPDGDFLRIAASAEPEVPFTDLSAADPGAREAALADASRELTETIYDLAAAPLFRARLFTLEPERHELLFGFHHGVCDGWSVRVILKDLAALYEAELENRPAGLARPVQYRDYARWQADLVGTPQAAANEAYWLDLLSGPLPVLDVPTDRSRSSPRRYEAGFETFSIERDLYERFKRLGARHGCTPFTALLAAYQLLLARLSGQSDLVVGVPAAGQNMVGAEDLIGHCVNMLPLRQQLDLSQPFSAHLASVRRLVLDSLEHQNSTFGALIPRLSVLRQPGRIPLIEATFNLDRPRPTPEFRSLRAGVAYIQKRFHNFDLFFNFVETPDGIRLECTYAAALFDGPTIRRWARYFETLLRAIVAMPEESLSRLPLLTEEEQRQLLIEWNRTEVSYPREKSVAELFESQARRSPEAAAAVLEDSRLTYAELELRAGQLANRLRRLGVGPEVPVALCLDRSFEMVVALLAIFKAGGAYVPLDPAWPADRMKFVLEDSQARFAVTREAFLSRLGGFVGQVISIDSERQALHEESPETPPLSSAAGRMAYILYTSGSTGRPKGVVVEQHSLVNYLLWVNRTLPSLDLPVVSALTFDASLKQLFAPLLRAATVRLLPEECLQDPTGLLAALRSHGPTALNVVPSLWAVLLDFIESEPATTPTELRALMLGGERLPEDLVGRSLRALPGLDIWNLYGPTEATANATAGRITVASGVSIGRPISNTRAYVLDAWGNPAAIGVRGEILISGEAIARGYWNRPDLTVERFQPDPFLPGERVYRTGDLGRYRPDGSLEWLGRGDDQVKIRGFRIELGEIEGTLERHSGVREAAVVARGNGSGEGTLVAYYVTESAQELSKEDLREFLRGTLPGFMVPSSFLRLETLPRNRHGKVDRSALPEVESPGAPAEEWDPPRTPFEEQLTKIWAEVLGREKVGIRTNFFDSGGHSLLALKILSRVRDAFDVALPLRIMFEYPTVAELAREIEKERSSSTGRILRIRPRSRGAAAETAAAETTPVERANDEAI